MQYWLMKTEPETFSIDDLANRKEEVWDGVRNYTVRNFFRDQMKVGDKALLYHSSTKVVGVAGEMEVVKEAVTDRTQFDPKSPYYDPTAKEESPRWLAPTVRFVRKYPHVLPLEQLRELAALQDSPITKKGNRLSVIPLSKKEWDAINALLATL